MIHLRHPRASFSERRHRLYQRLLSRPVATPLCILQENKLLYITDRIVIVREVDFWVPHSNRILLKLEHLQDFSSTGSLYDRLYPWLFQQAEELGYIRPGVTPVIECSVGNAGAAFCHTARMLGYDSATVVLPTDIYASRKQQLLELGAQLEYSPPHIGPIGYVRLLEEMLRDNWRRKGKFGRDLTRLYPVSKIRKIPNAPYSLLVGEVLCQLGHARKNIGCPGRIHSFVFGVGSGNAVSQIGSALKSRDPSTRVVVCEHEEAPFVSHLLRGTTPEMGGSWSEPDYPATTIHGVPLNKLSLELQVVDQVISVPRSVRDEGWRITNDVLGLCAGRPSGLGLMASLELATAVENENILTVIFDHEGKYGRTLQYTPVAEHQLFSVEKALMVGV